MTLKHPAPPDLDLCCNPSLSSYSNVRSTGGGGSGAGWLTDRVPVCENGPWQLQCQCVGMCWWGGEEGEVVMVVVGDWGGATDQSAVPLLDWDDWALWQRTRTVTRVYRFCVWLFFALLRLCIDGQNMTSFTKELVYPLWFSLNVLLFLLTRRKSFLQSYHDISV